jgi:putative iron-only hydrogenase system regulator
LHIRAPFSGAFFCNSDESKSGIARNLDDRLQSRNVPFGTSDDSAYIRTFTPYVLTQTFSIRRQTMDTRIALIGVILETRESVDELNHLLSDYGKYVIGRMGLPYKEKGLHIISIAIDAPNNIISALSGKLGMLPGVSTKTIYGKAT